MLGDAFYQLEHPFKYTVNIFDEDYTTQVQLEGSIQVLVRETVYEGER